MMWDWLHDFDEAVQLSGLEAVAPVYYLFCRLCVASFESRTEEEGRCPWCGAVVRESDDNDR